MPGILRQEAGDASWDAGDAPAKKSTLPGEEQYQVTREKGISFLLDKEVEMLGILGQDSWDSGRFILSGIRCEIRELANQFQLNI